MAYISEPSLVDPQKAVYVDKLKRIDHLPDPVAHPHLFQMQKSPSIHFLSPEALNESWSSFVLSDSYLHKLGGHDSFPKDSQIARYQWPIGFQ